MQNGNRLGKRHVYRGQWTLDAVNLDYSVIDFLTVHQCELIASFFLSRSAVFEVEEDPAQKVKLTSELACDLRACVCSRSSRRSSRRFLTPDSQVSERASCVPTCPHRSAVTSASFG